MDTYALACLDALVSEADVTRAAQRVGIGQPAMSEMLAKLRVLFNDPFLVRGASRHDGYATRDRGGKESAPHYA